MTNNRRTEFLAALARLTASGSLPTAPLSTVAPSPVDSARYFPETRTVRMTDESGKYHYSTTTADGSIYEYYDV